MDTEPRSNPGGPVKCGLWVNIKSRVFLEDPLLKPQKIWNGSDLNSQLDKWLLRILSDLSLDTLIHNPKYVVACFEDTCGCGFCLLEDIIIWYRGKAHFFYRNHTPLNWKGQEISKWIEASGPSNFYGQEANRENHSTPDMDNILWT